MFNALYSVWREVIYSCKSAFSFTSLPPTRRLSSSLSGVGWNMEWEHSIDIIDISSEHSWECCVTIIQVLGTSGVRRHPPDWRIVDTLVIR